MMKKLNRTELIILVTKIMMVDGTEAEIDEMIDVFSRNVPHTEASDLIFWSQNFGLGPSPSAEEVVDKALSYKPIQL